MYWGWSITVCAVVECWQWLAAAEPEAWWTCLGHLPIWNESEQLFGHLNGEDCPYLQVGVSVVLSLADMLLVSLSQHLVTLSKDTCLHAAMERLIMVHWISAEVYHSGTRIVCAVCTKWVPLGILPWKFFYLNSVGSYSPLNYYLGYEYAPSILGLW